MGTVTNLAEYRTRKSVESNFRPMTDTEWGYYLKICDYRPEELEKRAEAVDRCFVIIEQLSIFEYNLKKNLGRRRFSEAVQRGLLRSELLGLTKEYGFIEFTGWIKGES